MACAARPTMELGVWGGVEAGRDGVDFADDGRRDAGSLFPRRLGVEGASKSNSSAAFGLGAGFAVWAGVGGVTPVTPEGTEVTPSFGEPAQGSIMDMWLCITWFTGRSEGWQS